MYPPFSKKNNFYFKDDNLEGISKCRIVQKSCIALVMNR